MRAITKPIILTLVSAGFLFLAPTRSRAGTITYTETVQATGTLGTSSFTNALVTLTFVGDTTNVTNPSSGIYRNSIGTATVAINGTTATLTAPVDVFVNQTSSTAGIETFATVLTVNNSALATYDLKSSVGLLTGTSGGTLNTNFATSSGSLNISSFANIATFQATVSTAVPEPASLLLAGIAIAAMVSIRLRSAGSWSKSAG